MRNSKSLLKNQDGFTLIEIIAVLVLLGILAAVAVPKYFDLQQDSANKAADAAVAEGIAQVNQVAAKYILKNGTVPTKLEDLTGNGLTTPYEEGDFSIAFADSSPVGSIVVTAAGKASTSVANASATKTIKLPQ